MTDVQHPWQEPPRTPGLRRPAVVVGVIAAVVVAAVVTFLLADRGPDEPVADPTTEPAPVVVPASRVEQLRSSLTAAGLRCFDLTASTRCYDRARRTAEPYVLVQVDLTEDGGVGTAQVAVQGGGAGDAALLRELATTTGSDLFGLAADDVLPLRSGTLGGDAGPELDVLRVDDDRWLASVDAYRPATVPASGLPSTAAVRTAAARAGLRCAGGGPDDLACDGDRGVVESGLRLLRSSMTTSPIAVEGEVEGEQGLAATTSAVLDLLRPTGVVGPGLGRLVRSAPPGATVEGDVDGVHAVVRAVRYGPTGGDGTRVGVEVSLSPVR